MRRSICSATFSETNCASSSGVLISWMSILTCFPCAILEISSVIFSISAPLRPITIPGRAVKIVTRMLFHARSITIFETAAYCSFFFTYFRISKSECKNAGSSWGEAYQRERQSRFTPSRKPIGLTFCPISQYNKLLVRFPGRLFRSRLLLSLRLFGRVASCGFFPLLGPLFRFLFRLSSLACFNFNFVRKHDSNMTGPLQNPARATPGTRHDPLERRAFAYDRFFYDQSVRLEVCVVLGISDRTFQCLVDKERRFLRCKSKQIER